MPFLTIQKSVNQILIQAVAQNNLYCNYVVYHTAAIFPQSFSILSNIDTFPREKL